MTNSQNKLATYKDGVPPPRERDSEAHNIVQGAVEARQRTDDLNRELQKEIAERQMAEQAARVGELRYHTLFDLVPVAVYSTDAEGVIQEFNRRAVELWGRTPQNSEKFCGSFKIYYPDGTPMPHEKCPMARVLRGEELSPAELEIMVEQTSGARKHVIVSPSTLKDQRGAIIGAINCLHDITQRKRAEEALRSSEERFRLLVEGARDYAMFLLNADNRISYWSTGAERIFGWTAEEAVGKSGDLIFTPADKRKGAVEKEIGVALRDGRAPDRRYHMRKDGSRFWTDGVLMRLDDDAGNVRGFAKVARDATDQRHIEDELRHARDEFEQRVLERTRELLAINNELERTMAQRQQLEKELLVISEREKRRIGEDLHDVVCQELTAAALFLKSSAAKIARETPAAAKTLEEAAQIVNRNVTLARNLARGFQPMQLSAGKFTAAMRALVRQASASRSINCHLEMPSPIHLHDETIGLNLYRIAQEALVNAVKHSGADAVKVSLNRDRDCIRLVVEDNGKGFRANRRSKGLGLHIMKYRCSALGGTFAVNSKPNGGTRITCTVPLKASSATVK